MNIQSAKVLVLLWELAHLDDSNDMLQSICEVQVAFLFIVALFILIRSKWKLTWDSHIVCGVSLESSRWHHTPGRAKTFAGWVWHSSHIGDLFLKIQDFAFFQCLGPSESKILYVFKGKTALIQDFTFSSVPGTECRDASWYCRYVTSWQCYKWNFVKHVCLKKCGSC